MTMSIGMSVYNTSASMTLFVATKKNGWLIGQSTIVLYPALCFRTRTHNHKGMGCCNVLTLNHHALTKNSFLGLLAAPFHVGNKMIHILRRSCWHTSCRSLAAIRFACQANLW